MGCRRKEAATELVRIVRSPDGDVGVGPRLPGRGAWLCAVPGPCLDIAVRRKALERALRAPLRPGAVDRLRANAPKRGRIAGRNVILNEATHETAPEPTYTNHVYTEHETERGQS